MKLGSVVWFLSSLSSHSWLFRGFVPAWSCAWNIAMLERAIHRKVDLAHIQALRSRRRHFSQPVSKFGSPATLGVAKRQSMGSATMTRARTIILTAMAMLAFAGNSLLCRAALRDTPIDAASFTSIRLISGAVLLGGLMFWRNQGLADLGSWRAALALFAYAACFSFAYTSLRAGTGALLLFGAVQATMIGWGIFRGERLQCRQVAGLLLASCGLLGLLWPGLSAPPPMGAALMVAAGISWGIYSLLGKGSGDPLRATAGNFIRSAVPAILLSAICLGQAHIDGKGAMLALASGALTSGLGYSIWYAALPHLKASQAATSQLSVPVIAAFAAVPLLGEALSLRLALAAIAVLGGIALVIHPGKAIKSN